MKRPTSLLALFVALTASAHARDRDGALGTLILPNSGRPACVVAGEQFGVLLRGSVVDLFLEREGLSLPLEVSAAGSAPGVMRLSCNVPSDASPGAYTLRAGEDVNRGAVFVFPLAPQTYSVAFHQVREPGELPDFSLFESAAEAGASFFVVGGISSGFDRLVPLLDQAPLPVFVIPTSVGKHDYERHCGPAEGGFRFGPDGYLCFTSGHGSTLESLGNEESALQWWQRLLKPCRWRIGLGDRVDSLMGMRRQLVLFVDNPLDYCLVGEAAGADATVPVFQSPWGRTLIGVPSAATGNGTVYIRVSDAGLEPVIAGPAP